MEKSKSILHSDEEPRWNPTSTVQSPSTIAIPSMNMHNDFLSFLAVAQYYELDFLSITWQPALGHIGIGGTSEIRQSALDSQTSFAFKCITLTPNSSPQSDVADGNDHDGDGRAFNAMVAEISVLGHPLLRHHQNIVNLEGICWEIPPGKRKVWPVLILEKAQLGDLQSFVCSEQGRRMGMRERIELCTDVASALIALHKYQMTHCDIKPQNVLVFKDNIGAIFAKLSDFGYAGWALDESHGVPIKPPRSRPWDAPEYHHRGFSLAEARKLDIFSFGMLCLWTLFEDRLSSSELEFFDHLGDDAASVPLTDQRGAFRNLAFIDRLKQKDTLSRLARELVQTEKRINHVQREKLIQFFSLALACCPESRAMDIQALTAILDQKCVYGPETVDLDQRDIDHSKLKFEISKSFYPLIKAHRQVRKYVACCLQNQVSGNVGGVHNSNAAFQLALCYKIGFGVPLDEVKSQRWLQEVHRSAKCLEVEIELAKERMNRGAFRNGNLTLLAANGMLVNQRRWQVTEDMDVVEAECKREIRDLRYVLGEDNLCLVHLKLELASALEHARKYEEAAILRIELLEQSKTYSGRIRLSYQPRDLSPVVQHATYARTVRARSNITRPNLKPPTLTTSLREMEEIMTFSDIMIPETLATIDALASNFIFQQRWKDAEWLFIQVYNCNQKYLGEGHPATLKVMSTIAGIYMNQGRYRNAERTFLYVADMLELSLGAENESTLYTQSQLAEVYTRQARWKEAEYLAYRVWETQKKVLGIGDVATRRSMMAICSIHSTQGLPKKAETLRRQLLDISANLLGPKHPDTLTALSDLSVDLAAQGLWKDAEELTQGVLRDRKKILGENHTDTLSSFGNLAAIFQRTGSLTQSVALLLRLIKVEGSVLGEDHPTTINLKSNLAIGYMSQGKYEEAEHLHLTVLQARTKELGEEHFETLNTTIYLASTYLSQTRLHEAEAFISTAIAKVRKSLVDDHPQRLRLEAFLAQIYLQQKRFSEGNILISPIFEAQRRILGAEHEQTLDAMETLAKSLRGMRRHEEANAVFMQLLETRTKVRGENAWVTRRTALERAANLWEAGRWQTAARCFYLYHSVRFRNARLPRIVPRLISYHCAWRWGRLFLAVLGAFGLICLVLFRKGHKRRWDIRIGDSSDRYAPRAYIALRAWLQSKPRASSKTFK